MDKRFLTFLLLMFLILTLNVLISKVFFPPAELPPAAKKEVAAKKVDEKPAPDAAAAPEAADADEKPASMPEIKAVDVPQQWLTIGSADPNGPYRILATFNNHGAAVRRLELSSDRYNELNNRTGYLGHLQPVQAEGGVRVQVVGAGTPAALAGMKPNDVIVKLGDKTIDSNDALQAALAATRPGQKLEITVERDGQAIAPLTATLAWTPLQVMGPEARNLLERRETPPPDFVDPPSYLLTLSQIGKDKLKADERELPGVDLITGNWEVVEHDEAHIIFRKTLPAHGIEVTKRFTAPKVAETERENPDFRGYHLDFELQVRNLTDKEQTVVYRLEGPTGLPTEGWWYSSKISRNWSGAGLRDLVRQYEGHQPVMYNTLSIVDGDVPVQGQGDSLMFAAMDAQYFASALLPQKEKLDEKWFETLQAIRIGPEPDDRADKRLINVTFQLTSLPLTLEPAKEIQQGFTLFAGPKRPRLLAQYGQGDNSQYNLSELVYFGWPIWAAVAKIMLGVLHFFYDIVQNYGIAIILLTVVVRGLMFPLSRKQALNMVKMQELQPEIKRIQEKYKKDLEGRNKAQQELFRKNNYNPMGGCLLMFVQLPVFLGLYRALMVDVELRQAPLFGEAIRWCSNLAAPDMLYDWSSFMPDFVTSGVGVFGLGPYLNILPIFTVVLFIFQQKMFMPPPADEQAALQQKMMQYMMIFIGLMFYKVASGLCLYFIASTLWGMAERKFLPKSKLALAGAAAVAASAPAPSAAPSSNGKNRSGRSKRKQK